MSVFYCEHDSVFSMYASESHIGVLSYLMLSYICSDLHVPLL